MGLLADDAARARERKRARDRTREAQVPPRFSKAHAVGPVKALATPSVRTLRFTLPAVLAEGIEPGDEFYARRYPNGVIAYFPVEK